MGNLCASCFGGGGDGDASGGTNLGSRDTYQTFPADSGNRSSRVQPQPDPEERRRQVAEAAEKRRQEQDRRGVKNIESIRRQQQRQDELERLEEEARHRGGDDKPAMRWQVS